MKDDKSQQARRRKLSVRQEAIRLKAFRNVFSRRDVRRQLGDKNLIKKLRQSKVLEQSYARYLKELERNPHKQLIFPWDSFFKQALFWLRILTPRFLKWLVTVCLILFVINYVPGPTQHIVEILGAQAIYKTAGIKRLPASLESYAHSARIVDRDGKVIKSYGKRRVTLEVPEKAQKALLACEDRYFMPDPGYPWYVNTFLIHPGVSWINILGAIADNLRGNRRGASTIVMQNAKKILGNDQRTIANKLEEIIVSYILVSRFGKEKNLLFYVNTVPVGGNIYGFPAAARNFFKKDLDELNYRQILAIASVIPNHNRLLALYDITRGKQINDLSEKRRGYLKSAIRKFNRGLQHLRDINEISQIEYQAWRLSDELSIRKLGLRDFVSPLYGEEEWTSWNVIKEVSAQDYLVDGRRISGTRLLLEQRGDVVIETGVNLGATARIKEVIGGFLAGRYYKKLLRRINRNTWKKDLARYRKKMAKPPFETFDEFMSYLYRHVNVGVMIINQAGEIISYVGGKEFLSAGGRPSGSGAEESLESHRIIIDLMNKKARISPSSTIKPVIAYYALATDRSRLDTTFPDRPLEYKYIESEKKEVWLPRNWYRYDARGKGKNRYFGREYSLVEAQLISINTIFARLSTDRKIRGAMLAGFDKINLDYNREDARYWPFGIGATTVPVRPWLGVYNAFLDGYYREPRFVKRIRVNDEIIYERRRDLALEPKLLFDADRERENEMMVLYEVCKRGTAAGISRDFIYAKNLVSGKTGTAQSESSSLFISNFNPYQDRETFAERNLTMLVTITTNSGGFKKVGTAGQGPVRIAGRIYSWLFEKELRAMIDRQISEAKKNNSHFRNNHLYWSNVNKYMNTLLHGSCGKRPIHEYIIGVDGYEEALAQILSGSSKIYTGRDELFNKLVGYYCDQEKIVEMRTGSRAETPVIISRRHKISPESRQK